ncbi:MAG TPA: hypothetical protein VGO86_07205 [Candidatus Dormibacteraeota bacterium]|jgi:cellulose synthase/poly-beta-1,6-N-acetylglucosamine synthase-like glycosyltransferase
MGIDELVRLLEDRDVGLWCKRAAWIVAIANTVVVVFQLLGLLAHPDVTTLPIALLSTLAGYVVTTAWYFFVLYALGAIVTHLVKS